MQIVKLGGSLNDDPLLPEWLEMLSARPVVIVAGGGRFADAVRGAQQRWRFDDATAHNMAVLAMAQSALLHRALRPALGTADGAEEIHAALKRGRAVVWTPYCLLRETGDDLTNWGVTSDSLALWLARTLHARRVLIVKACPIDAAQSFEQLAERGVLDRRFPAFAHNAPFTIELLHKTELGRARALLDQ